MKRTITSSIFNAPQPPKRNANKPWLTVRNEGDVIEMIISGHIGASWWDDSGTTSKEFREKFAAIPKGTKVNVRINSEGGSVSDALEIYNCIQARKDDVTTFNDGYALSSASIILCAGGRAVTPHASLTMIHEPWSMTVGDETDHIKAAQMLSKHGDTIAEIYARKTGKPAAEMREAMRTETWFTGAEAAEFGFSDTDKEDVATDDEELIEDRVRKLDVSAFKNVPQHIIELVQGRKRVSTPAMAAADPKKSNLMDKKKILAALKARGIELAEDASDETILEAFNKLNLPPPKKENDPPPEPTPVNDGEVKALRKQLDDEKRVRVTAEIKRRGENKIENKNLNWWINLAMQPGAEAEVLGQIDGLPVNRPGGEPKAFGISIVENRLEEIRKEASPAKRYRTLSNEWDGLIRDALLRDSRIGMAAMMPAGPDNQGMRMYPVAANTYSATLVTQFLLDGAVTKLQNLWAPLRVFTRDYSQDRYKPRATAQLKYVTTGGATQTNATNFESGDAVVTNVEIAVNQYSTAFHVTNDELNSGLRMENLVAIKTADTADNILKIAFKPLATGSFTTNAAIVRTAAAFAFSDMATAWGELKKSPIKYAVLDGEYMARIINSPVFYQVTGTGDGEIDGWKRFGWDGVWTNTNWTGTHAGAGDQYIRGLFCNPQVMGAVAGIPLTPPAIPGNTLQESTITVPDVNISIAAYSWFSLATRTFWMSYDLMFGTALLDESAGVLLTSQ